MCLVWGSTPDGVIENFHWHNPSRHYRTLGPTHPLTKMSIRNISWVVKAAGAYNWQPSTSVCQSASSFWNPQGLYRDCLTFACTPVWRCTEMYAIDFTWSAPVVGLGWEVPVEPTVHPYITFWRVTGVSSFYNLGCKSCRLVNSCLNIRWSRCNTGCRG